jgi:hypothetical protein
VHGEGVVGEQPVLEPGQSFEYTSGTPLPTPSGFMRGAYHMQIVGTGEAFDVEIPAFSLDSPHLPTSRVIEAGGVEPPASPPHLRRTHGCPDVALPAGHPTSGVRGRRRDAAARTTLTAAPMTPGRRTR